MRILALDYSTHAGWAFFEQSEGSPAELQKHGTLHAGCALKDAGDREYPWNYLALAEHQAAQVHMELIEKFNPHVIVIEETNGSKNRYTQKLLEFLHAILLDDINNAFPSVKVVYVNTNDWRSNLGIWLTKEQKRNNAKLSKAKSEAKRNGKKLDKKKLGIAGKVTKKHAAIAYVNDRFGFKLKVKDNDAAEAICIGLAYLNNVSLCDGV